MKTEGDNREKGTNRRSGRIVTPDSKIVVPESPHAKRMRGVSDRFAGMPPPGTEAAAKLQALMKIDIAFQQQLEEIVERVQYICCARECDGSGLQLSTLLRSYFAEYNSRLFQHGPGAFPSSFNVLEAFMAYDRKLNFFDLRPEVEHLLSLNGYVDWYTAETLPRDPMMLSSIIPEGVVHSYEMISSSASFRIAGDIQQVIAGVSIVRHRHELSCLLLAGENPPLMSDDEAEAMLNSVPFPGREGIAPAEDLGLKDRYLDGYPDHAKVIVLTRLDLRSSKHDVRYVNVDNGASFRVFTDDMSAFGDLPRDEAESFLAQSAETLEQYSDLFSFLLSLIYLPAYFVADAESVNVLNVATELQTMRKDKDVRRTINAIGPRATTERSIRCMPIVAESGTESRVITPPPTEFQCDGYWKPIGPLEVGEGIDGEKTFGRTWVSRHESWSIESPRSFMVKKPPEFPPGDDPGVIYVQRSPSHGADIYKIGLTRRDAEVRAKELSSATGVPLSFGVLATWNVGNCELIEAEVHKVLAAFRINPRREFFRAQLSQICRVIGSVVRDLS